ncbi:MAG: hypothetical protein F4213_01925 [Boseongicola sp. SB0677_bin_26]|nr:hypothetical protein [Boseongicola sp. SB0677_bin_26]
MTKYRKTEACKAIYCLEGNWYGPKDQTTVEPALTLLERNRYLQVPCLHFDIATRSELAFRLKAWAKPTFKTHTILYLGFHGEAGKVCLGSKQEFSLSDLSNVLKDSCRHRVIHFGSCSTLEVDNARLKEFRRQTGALALFGYRSDVDWLHAIAFEVLLLGELQYLSFTHAGMKGLDSRLNKAAATLRENLGFGMHYGRL